MLPGYTMMLHGVIDVLQGTEGRPVRLGKGAPNRTRGMTGINWAGKRRGRQRGAKRAKGAKGTAE